LPGESRKRPIDSNSFNCSNRPLAAEPSVGGCLSADGLDHAT
jgi:hypothetical protein